MNNRIIAVLVALAATLTYAETVQEPAVETDQGAAEKVVPGAVECHNGSLKKPKAGANCHHGTVKKPEPSVTRETDGDQGNVSAPAEAATTGEVKAY